VGPLITSGLVVIGGVVVTIAVAFTSCAIAEFAVRLAVRLYAPAGPRREIQREVWLDTIQQLKPQERPGHAGAFLWAGVATFAGNTFVYGRMRFEVMWCAYRIASVSALAEPVYGMSVGRLRRWRGIVRSGRTISLAGPWDWLVDLTPEDREAKTGSYARASRAKFHVFCARYERAHGRFQRATSRFQARNLERS
jgi:hypothetical protein